MFNQMFSYGAHDLLERRFGQPIAMDDYQDEFFSAADGSRRSAVKRLTRTIETALVEMTINAPDW
jgi:glycerol-3-phosphate O-acyltransferase/dihydroxyacetone phosphate acyltransferase